jgi:citrate synthase
MEAARAVEKSFADARKPLPINVDGAIGAILADLGMNPAAINGMCMIARPPAGGPCHRRANPRETDASN